jgi:parallel beta-helix repeat protein
MNRRRLVSALAAVALSVGIGTIAAGPALAAGTDWWVDGASPTCSNAGSGTVDVPFCTIAAAATRATTAGDVVHVRPASYAEQVTVAGSGVSGAPITFQAEGAGVVLVGTKDLTGNVWTAGANGTWSTPYTSPNSAPAQAFYDGGRLVKATGASGVASGQWFYDATAKVIYVNVGGASPADTGHTVTAGAQTYAFNVNGRSNIVITGFGTLGQNLAGVHVGTSSTAVTISSVSSDLASSNGVLLDGTSIAITVSGSTVTRSGSVGIRLATISGSTISGNTVRQSGLHGFSLTGSSGNTLVGNESADNVVTVGANTAAGIDINASSPNNTVTGNLLHGNQDSGIQLYNGSNNGLVTRNISYGNGNHGFDTLASTGVRYVGNTSYGNHDDGFSVEGLSTGATLRDNISVDNGLATAGANLYVEGTSATGLTADNDIFWNSAWVPAIQIGLTRHRTVADYAAATGQEAHGLGQDPHFVDAAAGNFALSPNSPAIDSADSSASGFQANDRTGTGPADDRTAPDTGLGSPAYADRGALERVPQAGDPTATAPNAALVLSATSGQVPPAVPVTADATGSSDADAQGIASYTFDFGDGTVVGPQPGGTAQHSYIASGAFVVRVTVTDTGGLAGSAQRTVSLSDRPLVTYTVDNRNTSCSDTADGVTTPFCTISRAAALALAGDTVVVNPGDYLEQVTPAHTGMATAPLTFRANGSGVRVLGTTDLSNAAAWTATATTAWSTAVTSASPITQVFLDGTPLTKASSATTTTTNSFFYDVAATRLYVDTGGSNPASGHTVLASTRTYGFKLWNADTVVVDGFETFGQNGVGVSVQDASAVMVSGVTVRGASSYGISSDRSTGLVVSGSTSTSNGSIGIRVAASSNGAKVLGNTTATNGFHGISVQGSNGVTVADNTSTGNALPASRVAAGIDISGGSTGAVVERNTTYANQDSGIQIYTDSANATVRRNLSYDNGDHGLDCFRSTGDTVVGNTVVGNSAAGINLEGGCSGSTVADNISSDNAVDSTRTIGDLRLDEASSPGSTVRTNLVFMTAGGPLYEWNSAPYTTVAAFQAATAQGVGDLGADPQFSNPVGRDLSLRAASPGVDSADLSVGGASVSDHDKVAPVDVLAVPNTGGGTPAYGDRGALEYHGALVGVSGPTAAVTATPASGFVPLVVAVSGGGSTAGGSAITTYAFDCGNGTTTGAQPGSSTTCSYPAAGTYTATLKVVDGNGFTSSDSATVTANTVLGAPVARLTATPTSGTAPLVVSLDASQSTDPQGLPLTYTFLCGNGTQVGPGPASTASCTYTTAGTYTAKVTASDTLGLSGSATSAISVAANQAPKAVLKLTTAPGKTAPTTATFDASGSSDPEGGALTYTFKCGNGTSVGPQSTPTATCTYNAGGTFNAKVTVTDPSGASANSPSIKLSIGSNMPPTASMSVQLSSTKAPATASINASASSDPEGGPLTYRFDCGNGTPPLTQTTPTATCSYTSSGRYTIKLTVTDNTGQTGTASTSFRL